MTPTMRILPWLLPLVAVVWPGAAHAAVRTEAIDYQDGQTTLKGFLAYDDSTQGRRPGVIIAPEWWGLTNYPKHRAQQLAALGYVALAADIYGNGQVATTPADAGKLAGAFRGGDRSLMRSRITAALETLRKDPRVDPARIACIGYCFGGTAALELARSGADIAGVVSIHGGLDAAPGSAQPKILAKVLVLHGADDPTVKPEVLTAFQDEMRHRGVDWQFISYGGAMHGFSNPDADKAHLPPVRYNAAADRRSWQHMLVFFHEIFGEEN